MTKKAPDFFTAIDFETMTGARSSACAIGLVKVVNGQIVQKYYSLINPIPDDRETDNSHIHGITREMVKSAPRFKDIWPTIVKITAGSILVAHNAKFDESVWNEQLAYYRCTQNPSQFQFLCTYQMTGLSLEDACAKHNINMGNHHDALDDALACAKVMLAESGILQVETFKGGKKAVMEQLAARTIDRAVLVPLDDDMIENKETPFFRAKTVITGVFTAYPIRDELAKILHSLGADICSSISKRTNIVVVGSGAGPAKLKKIEKLRNEGFDIRVIFEPELITHISK